MQLNKNVILITGGTSGIGLELVRQLYEFDNKLIVSSSNQDNLDKLKIKFPNISTLTCDLGDSLSVRKLIDTCIAEYNNINIVINNAGIQNNYIWTNEKEGYRKIENEIHINFTRLVVDRINCYGCFGSNSKLNSISIKCILIMLDHKYWCFNT